MKVAIIGADGIHNGVPGFAFLFYCWRPSLLFIILTFSSKNCTGKVFFARGLLDMLAPVGPTSINVQKTTRRHARSQINNSVVLETRSRDGIPHLRLD